MSAEWELQKAVFNILSTGLTAPVYDFVQQKSAPSTYVTVGDDTLLPFNADITKGFEATLTIHAWDISNGRKDVKELQGEIYNLLDRAELVISGYNPIGIDFQFSETTLDPDGVTYHGVQRFRFLMTEQ